MKTLLLSAQDKATPEIAANLIRQDELVAILRRRFTVWAQTVWTKPP